MKPEEDLTPEEIKELQREDAQYESEQERLSYSEDDEEE